jgi:hypothetical protein
MRAWTVGMITAIAALSLAALPPGAADARRPPGGPKPTCDPGSTARLTIVNQCADNLWVVITAPGAPAQVAVRAQWDWVDAYVTHENVIDTGGIGSINRASPRTLTVTKQPNPALVPGMKIKILKGARGGDLITTVASVSSNAVGLADAGVPVTDAPIWFFDGQKAFSLAAGSSRHLCVPDKGAPSGNFRFFMGCPSLADDTDPFNTTAGCVIGSAFGDGAGINTLFEPSFGCVPPLRGAQCAFNASSCSGEPSAATCDPLSATDFFDISAVDGYTFPIRVGSVGSGCSAPSKDASMLDLASCPTETSATLFSTDSAQQALIEAHGIRLLTQDATHLKSCAAPYKWFASTGLGSPQNPTLTVPSCPAGAGCNSVSYYAGAGCDNTSAALNCPGGSGPQQKVGPKRDGTLAIQNTNFVQQLRALGYTGYTWQYDDGIGAQTCDAGAQMTVTLCPSGSSPKPYQKNALWRWSASTGACTTDGTTGAPDGHTTFGALFACQAATMQYTCTDLTAADPFELPIGVWAANAAATLSPTALSRTYARFQSEQQLVCEDTPELTIPASPEFSGGTVTVKNCTYYADSSKHVCPE